MNGLGAMIHYLGGGSKESADKYYGRKISSAVFDKSSDRFRIEFDDGVKIEISDQGQSCCENRYMTCDDDPNDIVGGNLESIEVSHGSEPAEYDDHEVAFLKVVSTKGSITFATHNEHNGYYGGFGLDIREVSK